MLEGHDRDIPDAVAVAFEDGSEWTYRDALDNAYRAAAALRERGVGRGSHVFAFLPNGPGFLRTWWGTACLGATLVPVSPSWKGEMLGHAVTLTHPELIVSCPELRPVIEAVAGSDRLVDAAELAGPDGSERPAAPELDRPIEVWDRHHIQFTSGTTGPSKGVTASYYQFHKTGSWVGDGLNWDRDDVVLCDLPLFHAGMLAVANSCLSRGGRLAVRSAPAMTRYWEVAAQTGATFTFLVSSMAAFLLSRPPGPADRAHRVRAVHSAPLPADVDAFLDRFGIPDITTAFGSSESGAPMTRVPGHPLVPGSCGRPNPPYESRLVDANDIEVPVGEAGELVVRSSEPWCVTTGYYNDDAATARAWRNGWFHTGDQLRRDTSGNYYFVDRVKDSLRRRGENISSFEVERGAAGYPGITEVACVAAPADAEIGEGDEVKLWVQPEPGVSVDLLALARHLEDRLPHYMIPRFYEVIDDLPRTPSMRVRKVELRKRGNSTATVDLHALGYRITRDGVVPAG
jgi:crotonobetaine/carnitine-CoA ligase